MTIIYGLGVLEVANLRFCEVDFSIDEYEELFFVKIIFESVFESCTCNEKQCTNILEMGMEVVKGKVTKRTRRKRVRIVKMGFVMASFLNVFV